MGPTHSIVGKALVLSMATPVESLEPQIVIQNSDA